MVWTVDFKTKWIDGKVNISLGKYWFWDDANNCWVQVDFLSLSYLDNKIRYTLSNVLFTLLFSISLIPYFIITETNISRIYWKLSRESVTFHDRICCRQIPSNSRGSWANCIPPNCSAKSELPCDSQFLF